MKRCHRGTLGCVVQVEHTISFCTDGTKVDGKIVRIIEQKPVNPYQEKLQEFANEVLFRFCGGNANTNATPSGVSQAEMLLQKAVNIGLVKWV